MNLLSNQRMTQAEGSFVSDMDGEKVMLSIQSGKYYNLGQTGGRIWELLAVPVTIDQMTECLSEEYNVEPSICKEQVTIFVSQLLQEGLVMTVKEG